MKTVTKLQIAEAAAIGAILAGIMIAIHIFKDL